MAAEFQVHRAFSIERRSLFALEGIVTEGMVRTGMEATLPGDEDAFRERVHGVEFLDHPQSAGGPTLTFHYSRDEKLRRWEAIDWEGRCLRLEHVR